MTEPDEDLTAFDLWRDSGLARGATYAIVAAVGFSVILALLGMLVGNPELAAGG